MKQAVMIGLVMLAAGGVTQTTDDVNPGSLFPRQYVNPLEDRTARKVGDVLTILISETSTASFSANTNAEKADNNALTNVTRAVLPIVRYLAPDLRTGATSSVDGKGQTAQSGRLVARMTAMIRKINPNGTLVIEGSRSVQINKETQVFRLSGIIRRDDIRSDNTVLSESIAEAEIKMDGRGMISQRTRKGILTNILDWLF